MKQLLATVLASMFIASISAAEPVTFELKIEGPDGALTDLPLWLTQSDAPETTGKTNAHGIVRFTLDSTKSAEILVRPGILRRTENENDGAFGERIRDFRTRCRTLGLPEYWQFRVDLNQGFISKSVTVPRGLKLTVRPVGIPKFVDPQMFLTIPGLPRDFNQDRRSPSFSRFGVPAGEATVGFLEVFEQRRPKRAIPFNVPASQTDIEIGDVQVLQVKDDAKITVHQTWTKATDRPVIQRGAARLIVGCTLVSPDGSLILYNYFRADDPSKGPEPSHATLAIPAGTFYVLPGYFNATPEQVAIITRLRAGQDLSENKLPMFTVASGEEKSIEINYADLYSAIHAIEDGK